MVMIRSSDTPIWTFVFIATCVTAFVFQRATRLWIYLAFFPAFAIRSPWMFVTSIFLHADLTHLVFNLFALFFFGVSLERRVGRRLFASLFILSGIFGNVGYLVTASEPLVPALGASGAIYGVMGSLAILEPFKLVYVYGMVPLPMVAAALLWAIMEFTGLFVPSGIAHGAHLGGMLLGAFFGVYLRFKRRSLNSSPYYM
jgi:membrane associated rhomboid family serine protease